MQHPSLTSYTHIIETSAGQFCAVRAADADHCWLGISVKRSKIGYVARATPAGRREHLIRKDQTRLVATLAA